MKKLFGVFIFLLPLLFSSAGLASVIASNNVGLDGGSRVNDIAYRNIDSFIFSIYIEELWGGPPYYLFNLTVDESDVGTIFTLNSGANFDQAVTYFTDGIEQGLHFYRAAAPVGGGTSVGLREPFMFQGISLNSIDLEGFAITHFTWEFSEIEISHQQQGLSKTMNYFGTFVVHGQVPSPEPLALITIGLSGIIFTRRINRYLKS